MRRLLALILALATLVAAPAPAATITTFGAASARGLGFGKKSFGPIFGTAYGGTTASQAISLVGANAGDLVVISLVQVAATPAPPSGWTSFTSFAASGTNVAGYYRKLDGSEGSSVSVSGLDTAGWAISAVAYASGNSVTGKTANWTGTTTTNVTGFVKGAGFKALLAVGWRNFVSASSVPSGAGLTFNTRQAPGGGSAYSIDAYDILTPGGYPDNTVVTFTGSGSGSTTGGMLLEID